MKWFQRICQRLYRPSFPDDWFWDALQEIRNAYFEEERRHYWSLPEDDQFGHVFESLEVMDEGLAAARKAGWVPRLPNCDRWQ